MGNLGNGRLTTESVTELRSSSSEGSTVVPLSGCVLAVLRSWPSPCMKVISTVAGRLLDWAKEGAVEL